MKFLEYYSKNFVKKNVALHWHSNVEYIKIFYIK